MEIINSNQEIKEVLKEQFALADFEVKKRKKKLLIFQNYDVFFSYLGVFEADVFGVLV